MPPAAPDSAALILRLRQQLILAQVRIMELEDTRETLVPRTAELEQLRAAAQTIADGKIAEAAHLDRVLAELQVQRAGLEAANRAAAEEIANTRAALADLQARLATETAHVARLQAELAALRASPSWRWTAWLRALLGQS